MNGILLNGTHSSTIPATWKTTSRPIMPSPKIYRQDAPEQDSDYDFSNYNEDKILHYQDRVFEGTLTIVSSSIIQRNIALSKLAKWLFGSWKTLEFDDMPGTLWTARVENQEQISYELGRVGIATVYFRVKPFSNWFLNSCSGGIPLDSNVLLDSSIPLGLDLTSTYNFVSGNQTFTIDNFGDWYTEPIITVTGTFSQITIGIDEKVYTYEDSIQSGDTLVINCKNNIITKNGINTMTYASGDRFIFAPGENELIVNSDGTGTIQVLFDYKFINMAVI